MCDVLAFVQRQIQDILTPEIHGFFRKHVLSVAYLKVAEHMKGKVDFQDPKVKDRCFKYIQETCQQVKTNTFPAKYIHELYQTIYSKYNYMPQYLTNLYRILIRLHCQVIDPDFQSNIHHLYSKEMKSFMEIQSQKKLVQRFINSCLFLVAQTIELMPNLLHLSTSETEETRKLEMLMDLVRHNIARSCSTLMSFSVVFQLQQIWLKLIQHRPTTLKLPDEVKEPKEPSRALAHAQDYEHLKRQIDQLSNLFSQQSRMLENQNQLIRQLTQQRESQEPPPISTPEPNDDFDNWIANDIHNSLNNLTQEPYLEPQ